MEKIAHCGAIQNSTNSKNRVDVIKAGCLGSGKERKLKVGKSQTQKFTNTIIIAVGLIAIMLVVGIAGRFDYEYENRPSICRALSDGSTACYKP